MNEPDIKVGGTSGGLMTFAAGAALAAVSAWFFVDSVRVTTLGGYGHSGAISGRVGGGAGVIFLPIFVAIVALFVDASKKWAWALFGLGAAAIAIEILSSLRFFLDLKLSHFMIMLIGFAAGLGMVVRSFKAMPAELSADTPTSVS